MLTHLAVFVIACITTLILVPVCYLLLEDLICLFRRQAQAATV